MKADKLKITVLCEFERGESNENKIVSKSNLRGKVAGSSAPPMVGLSLHLQTIAKGKEYRILFDTSTSFDNLINNAEALNLDLKKLDGIFISHWHFDHTSALPKLLKYIGHPITVYAPPIGIGINPLNGAIKTRLGKFNDQIKYLSEKTEIFPGVFSSGSCSAYFPKRPIPIKLYEQAMAVNLNDGGAAIVGCSHPGVITMVEATKTAGGFKHFKHILGGFHFIGMMDDKEKVSIERYLYGQEFDHITGLHCTGMEAMKHLKKVFGGRYFDMPLGTTLDLE
jgi:7,8-dihydropterin-6-yl-methyl-4-(beta-D-ribofuranosyl)aminobenzene 5'-phosphate synthase